eukprot:TRINITY_DN8030_c0_g1_i1.p1 TRINITY_DN8030_c0_g1~~TRINITY_DN8030_c0_g1_i1.p1  ORF type:complete len:398 (-),score=67.35 TRINITY_DN8030_c0_g1_i1:86-1108(-)
MEPLYTILCEQFNWQRDEELVKKMTSINEAKIKELDATITDAEKNLGESEVREGHLAKAMFYVSIGDKDNAIAQLGTTKEKTVGLGQKLDILFTLIRMGFFWKDLDLVRRNIRKAKALIEKGGDWDRRNRLKVYEGLYYATIRKFKHSATLFLEALATFTAVELFSYNEFIFYTIVVSIVSVDRVTLKEKVIDSPEIRSVINNLDGMQTFLNSLYDSDYNAFFHGLVTVTDQLERDVYLSLHAKYFCRELRVIAYKQLLSSYRSVKLASIANDFGISVEFLDKELSRFIASGRLHCKIDKVGGIVVTTRPASKIAQYHDTIKQGDLLLNRVGKLSRIINL